MFASPTDGVRRIVWQFLLIEVGILGYALLLVLPVYFGLSFDTRVLLTDYVYWRTLAYLLVPTTIIAAILHSASRWVRVAAFSASVALAVHLLWRARDVVVGSPHLAIGLWWVVLTLLSLSLCWSCWGWARERQTPEGRDAFGLLGQSATRNE